MSRHRSPRGARAVTDPARPDVRRSPTTNRHRHRHGIVAAGAAATALAAVAAPAALHLPDHGARLSLSSEATRLEESAVSPVLAEAVAPAPTGSADLIKADERVRRQAEQSAAVERARAEVARAETERVEARQVEQARRASAAARDARVTGCGATGDYGGVASSVQTVGNALECVFPGREVLGVGSRGGTSDHPGGYALDIMTRSGDPIAECVRQNRGDLGVSYVIWDGRIDTGSGWEDMEDRGGDTANHRDHVHISFDRAAEPDISALRRCG